jgi:hypothetical protein
MLGGASQNPQLGTEVCLQTFRISREFQMEMLVKWVDKDEKRERKGVLTTKPPGATDDGFPILIPDDDGFLTANSPELDGVVLICAGAQARGRDNLIERAKEVGFKIQVQTDDLISHHKNEVP